MQSACRVVTWGAVLAIAILAPIVHRGMFDYLRRNETIGLQTLVIHCQFGGRPLITAVLMELLQYMTKTRDAWFTTHETLADWALRQPVDEHTYQSRYFAS